MTFIYSVDRCSYGTMKNANMPIKIIQNISMRNGMTFQTIWMQPFHLVMMKPIFSRAIYIGDITTNEFAQNMVILDAHQSIGLTVNDIGQLKLACKQLS